jgi:hypothetical protein
VRGVESGAHLIHVEPDLCSDGSKARKKLARSSVIGSRRAESRCQ